jgi:hypothetical protein
MPEQTLQNRPEIIAFPGDNAELPAKFLERQIYDDPERFKQAMKLGHTILNSVVLEDNKKENVVADTDKVIKAKELVGDKLKAIIEDEKLRRSIWFDDETEARFEKDKKYKELTRISPRTESVLKEIRFRQFAIFVDSVVEYKSQQQPEKNRLRRTG